MSPAHVAIWATSIVIVVGFSAAVWQDPQVVQMWFWLLPLAALAWVFLFAALGIPSLALLGLRERSPSAYIALLTIGGAAVGGLIGTANGVLVGGVIVGALVYACTGFWVIKASNVKADSTAESDASNSTQGSL